MLARITRIVISFVLVLSAYGAYSLLAVPLIEPAAVRHDSAGSSAAQRRNAMGIVQDQRKELLYWFRQGDWELSSPKVLETAQGKLLWKEHTRLEDPHFVRMTPCSLVFMPQGDYASEEERCRQAIVLRSPRGAILQFDAPFDLKRGDVGKLVGAELIGDVVIRSDQRLPGPEDDLRIETRDVKLAENRVSTPHEIKFRHGVNQGEGKDLYIELATPAEKAARPESSQFGSMKRLELARDVRMRLQPGNANMFPSGAAPPGAGAEKPAPPESKDAQPQPPVEVTCTGPFHFDLIRYVATFHDHVAVVRLNPDAPSDKLTCELLNLFFEAAPATAEPQAEGANQAEKSSPKLRPTRMTARGNPVVLLSPSNGVEARGQRLEYDIKNQRGKLFDKQEAFLRQESRNGQPPQEIHAQELEFESNPADPQGPPRMMQARGKGWLRGNPPPGQTAGKAVEQLHARWTQSLSFMPDEDERWLAVRGKAHVELPGSGSLDAEEIHLWLNEVPAPAAAPGQPPRKKLVPARMLAKGNAWIDSAQLQGSVGEIRLWFQQPAPVAPAAAPGPAAGPPAPAPPPEEPAERASSKQKFHVSGYVLQAKAILPGDAGGPTQITDVVLNGNVHCAETQTENPGEQPLVIEGDQLHMKQHEPENAIVTVTGQPACVDARGMRLEGGTRQRTGAIHLHRGTNRLWIDGIGYLSLPADQGLDGRPLPNSGGQRLEVTWTGRMDFDGQTAQFERDVLAKRQASEIRTPLLKVDFTKKIRFGAGGTNDRPEVRQVFCGGGVDMQNLGYDERGHVVSIERMHARDLTYQYASGDVLANGPDGWVTRVWYDKGDKKMALPGARSQKSKQPSAKSRGPGLSYLKVKFQRRMTGNQHRQITNFENMVRCVYGPVGNWQAELDPERPKLLGEEGFVLTCDRLEIAQAGTAVDDEAAFELTADGNAVAEGSQFLSRSRRLKYERTKDLLTLDGDGLAKAQLFRQERPGAPRSNLSARKIWFWPTTNDIKMDDFGSLEFSHAAPAKPKDPNATLKR